MRLTIQVEPLEASNLTNGEGATLPSASVALDRRVCFLEITKGNETIHELCGSLAARWSKLYPNKGPLNIRKLQDGRGRDLDLSYRVDEVFTDIPDEPIESLVRVFLTPPLNREDSVAPESGLRPQTLGKRSLPALMPSIEEREEPSSKKAKTRSYGSNGSSSARRLFNDGIVNGVKDSQEGIGEETVRRSKSKTSPRSIPASPPTARRISVLTAGGTQGNQQAVVNPDKTIDSDEVMITGSSPTANNVTQVTKGTSKNSVKKAKKQSTKSEFKGLDPDTEKPVLLTPSKQKTNDSSHSQKDLLNGQSKNGNSIDLTPADPDIIRESQPADPTLSPQHIKAQQRKADRKTKLKDKKKDGESPGLVIKRDDEASTATATAKTDFLGSTTNSDTKNAERTSSKAPMKENTVVVLEIPITHAAETRRRGRPSTVDRAKQIHRPEVPHGERGDVVPISAARSGADEDQKEYADETIHWAEVLKRTPPPTTSALKSLWRQYALKAVLIDKPVDEWTAEEKRAIPILNWWIEDAGKKAAWREQSRKIKAERAEREGVNPDLPTAGRVDSEPHHDSPQVQGAIATIQKPKTVSRISPPAVRSPSLGPSTKPVPGANSDAPNGIAPESNPEVGLEAQMSIGSPEKPRKRKTKDGEPKEPKKPKNTHLPSTPNPVSVPSKPMNPVEETDDVTQTPALISEKPQKLSRKQAAAENIKSPTLPSSKTQTPVPPPKAQNKKTPRPKARKNSSDILSDGSSLEKAVYVSSDEEEIFTTEEKEAERRRQEAIERAQAKAVKPSKPSKASTKKLEPKGDFQLASTRLKDEEVASKQKVNNTPNNTQDGNFSLDIRPRGFVPNKSLFASASTSASNASQSASASRATSVSARAATEDSSDESGSDSAQENTSDEEDNKRGTRSSSSSSSSESYSDSEHESNTEASNIASTAAHIQGPKGISTRPAKQADSRSTPAPNTNTKSTSVLAGRPSLSGLVNGSRSQSQVRSTPIPQRTGNAQHTPSHARVVGQVDKSFSADSSSSSSSDESSSSSDSDSDSDSDSENTKTKNLTKVNPTDRNPGSGSGSDIDPDLHPSRDKREKSSAAGDLSQSQGSVNSANGNPTTPANRSSFGGLKGWWSTSKSR